MRDRSRLLCLTVFALLFAASPLRAEQTIVFLRHGEKPAAGLGQITCQGLQRALRLPDVLSRMYGPPDQIYAPNPNVLVPDPAGAAYYVRPLATIEPTAIRFGLGVKTKYGYPEIDRIIPLLITPTKDNWKVYVAWEHQYLAKMVQQIMTTYGGGATVPGWNGGDYDSLYVVRVTYGANGPVARFQHDYQGLNSQPTSCP